MYRYRESGLSNVWLMDGYAWVQTSMGKALQIICADELEEAIEQAISSKNGSLTGEEFRYLRKSLDLSPGALAEMFGLSEKTISYWENCNPPKWADRLIRALWSDENEDAFPLMSFFEAGLDRVSPRQRSRRLVFTKTEGCDWHMAPAGHTKRC